MISHTIYSVVDAGKHLGRGQLYKVHLLKTRPSQYEKRAVILIKHDYVEPVYNFHSNASSQLKSVAAGVFTQFLFNR